MKYDLDDENYVVLTFDELEERKEQYYKVKDKFKDLWYAVDLVAHLLGGIDSYDREYKLNPEEIDVEAGIKAYEKFQDLYSEINVSLGFEGGEMLCDFDDCDYEYFVKKHNENECAKGA